MRFTKPATTFEDQVQLLMDRGLCVDDPPTFCREISHINYYRLRAYLIPFEAHQLRHTMQPEITVGQVLQLYNFDRRLRLLLMDAIERFEVSLRTQWAYHLAHTYSPHAHLNPELFSSSTYRYNLHQLRLEVKRSREPFIQHFRDNYLEELPPIWATCEVMSFGALSRWFSSLNRREDRQAIARIYQVDEQILGSFAHHLVTVRNACAHHNRIWNRQFTVTPKIPRKGPVTLLPFNANHPRKLYNTLVLLAYFLDIIQPDEPWWKPAVTRLIQSCPRPVHGMGAAPNGFDHPFWNPSDPPPDPMSG